jgi:hypothetical protein
MPAPNYDISPAAQAVALTKSDSTVIPVCRALYIGGAGDVAVVTANGSTVTFSGAVAGSIIPIAVTKLMSTNTTATLVLALY